MRGVGYRVSSAQGPETTRHGADLRPITVAHYVTGSYRVQQKNDVQREMSGGANPIEPACGTGQPSRMIAHAW
jgi:hypothetical protein